MGSGSGLTLYQSMLLQFYLRICMIHIKSWHLSPGELDLEILKMLHEKHPDARVENEVVEPSNNMLNKYKGKNERSNSDPRYWNRPLVLCFVQNMKLH